MIDHNNEQPAETSDSISLRPKTVLYGMDTELPVQTAETQESAGNLGQNDGECTRTVILSSTQTVSLKQGLGALVHIMFWPKQHY